MDHSSGFTQQLGSYRIWRNNLAHQITALRGWLIDNGLADAEAVKRLDRLLNRLGEDRLVVAFVAEFSRGKSELINALFFADYGARVLPSSAGRTTMCPTELSWQRGQAPEIALLPIETRAGGATVAELRQKPDAWHRFPLDVDSAEAMATTLRRVGDTRRVPAESAHALGFALARDGEAGLAPDAEGLVEIPCWRHALIHFPHPLLEQGLVVVDTPGLNAVGAEPELTLSLLPAANAVLFILAADTGVTQSDLSVWRDHVGDGKGRFVVLNKIDSLWDGLRSEADIDGELAGQVSDCARILALPADSIYPVSAQKGLVARINGDLALLERSRLPLLESALSAELLPAKRLALADSIATEARQLAADAREILAGRTAALRAELAELSALHGKNDDVITQLMGTVRSEKEDFERGLKQYYAVRNVFSRMTDALYAQLGTEALRSRLRATRDAMREARFTPQLSAAMNSLFAQVEEMFAAAEKQVTEIEQMTAAMREKFGATSTPAIHVIRTDPPAPEFSLADYRLQVKRLEEAFRRHVDTLLNKLTSDKRTLSQQFFETVAVQMRKIFTEASHDAERWLRSLMAPIEGKVREGQKQLKRRLENVKRIHEAADALDEKVDELRHDEATLIAQLTELEDLEAGLAAAQNAPMTSGGLRVAA